MITIIYSTHKDPEYNNKFRQHLLHTVGIKDPQILEYVNNNQFSLSEVYNKGISESIYDIVVCCHNDIKLEKGWGKKLLKDFTDNEDYGIIGKAGSCHFTNCYGQYKGWFANLLGVRARTGKGDFIIY